MTEKKITITEGPYSVEGGIPLYEDVIAKSEDGSHLQYRRLKQIETPEDDYHLCRCGRSKHAPFCDGSHAEQPPFDGPEIADRTPYRERAEVFRGQGIDLYDDNRCAYARICHYNGVPIWNVQEEPGEGLKQKVIEMAENCPTGRLTAVDSETGTVYEHDFEPSIVLVEDGGMACSGPLMVRGGVPLISQDGTEYERRNRYALCRCGQSTNIPFCDAMHVNARFEDGFEETLQDEGKTAESAGKVDSAFE